jgi:hypothetical protein
VALSCYHFDEAQDNQLIPNFQVVVIGDFRGEVDFVGNVNSIACREKCEYSTGGKILLALWASVVGAALNHVGITVYNQSMASCRLCFGKSVFRVIC